MTNIDPKAELEKIVEQIKNKNNPNRVIKAGNDEETQDLDAENQASKNKEDLELFRQKYNKS
jgi:hypothetical protein